MADAPHYRIEPRPDTGLRTPHLGLGLFLAAQVMFYAALLSAYVLLRTAAEAWPRGADLLNMPLGAVGVLSLAFGSYALATARQRLNAGKPVTPLFTGSALSGAAFVGAVIGEHIWLRGQGRTPDANTFLGIYYAFSAVHAAQAIAAVLLAVWLIAGARDERFHARLTVVAGFWHFLAGMWVAVFMLLYVF